MDATIVFRIFSLLSSYVKNEIMEHIKLQFYLWFYVVVKLGLSLLGNNMD